MDIFYLKLILSFIIGGIWITGATIIAERFGSKIGGIITGLPSTTVLALFFIGWTQSAQTASDATTIIPAVLGLDALFTAFYILLSKNRRYISIGFPLIFWFMASYLLVTIKFNSFPLSLLVWVILLILSYILGEKLVSVKSEGKRITHLTYPQIAFRGILSGTIIAASVLLTKLGGPIIGGIFASFPAIMLSTIIITSLSHGRDFSVAVMKVVMVSGGVNVVVYALAARILYIQSGLFMGTFLSFLISLISAYFMYQFVSRKMI